MHLTPRKSDSHRSTSSGGSFPSSRSWHRRASSRRSMEALVTLRKPSFSRLDASEPPAEDDVPDDQISMSSAAQKVIPATFKLVSLEGKNAVTSAHTDDPTFAQAGGHDGAFEYAGATLVKGVTEREARFYEQAAAGAWPSVLLPKYYGRTKAGDAIKIQNLTYGLHRPCVMDLKMGQQTVEDTESNLIKKLKMTALDVVTKSKYAGVRLEGLSMYRTLEKGHIKGTKAQSHSLSVRVSLQDVITFFLTDESGVRTDLALRFQAAIEGILRQFQNNPHFRFIGSSILFIYDNDNRSPHMRWARALRQLHTLNPNARLSEDQISGLTRRTKCDVRMIDFAHTGPMPRDMRRDDGYITGLHTILKALKAIREYRAKPIFSIRNAVVDVMEDRRAITRAASENFADKNADSVPFTFSTLLGELTPLLEGTPATERDGAGS